MKDKLSRIKIRDIFSPLLFILLLPLTLLLRIILKLQNRRIYLICEDPDQARDNGYSLYLAMKNKKINDVYYAINSDSKDRHKFIDKKSLINYGSIQHWIMYMVADKNISVHKAGSPSPAIFYLLHKYRLFNGNRVFLQHGVTMNYVRYLSKKECNFRYFITAAHNEHNYILENFGYDESNVKLLGFSRFDDLLDYKKNSKIKIAIMPTWRKYLMNNNSNLFTKSEFFFNWNGLISDSEFNKFLKINSIECIFYPHRNFFKYLPFFSNTDQVKIVNPDELDIKEVIKNFDIIITDYSSISIDFAYAGKPVIYYQFDKEEFRNKHLEQGYFSYENDGFGPVVETVEDVNLTLNNLKTNNFVNCKTYEKRRKDFFKYIDQDNNNRIIDLLIS